VRQWGAQQRPFSLRDIAALYIELAEAPVPDGALEDESSVLDQSYSEAMSEQEEDVSLSELASTSGADEEPAVTPSGSPPTSDPFPARRRQPDEIDEARRRQRLGAQSPRQTVAVWTSK
jgi:hypothetical protein